MSLSKYLWAFSFIWISSGALMAQTQQELTPLERKQLTVLDEPATLYKGFFRAILATSYSRLDKFVNDNGDRYYAGDAAGYSFYNYLILAYGLSDRLTIRLSIPYAYNSFKGSYQVESIILNDWASVTFDQSGGGIGDVGINLAYQLVRETPVRPSLRGTLDVIFPSGEKNPTHVADQNSYEVPVGDGRYKFNLELQVRKIIFPYTFTGFVYYQYNSKGEKVPLPGLNTLSFNSSYLFGSQIGGGIHLNDWLTSNVTLGYNQTESLSYSVLGELTTTIEEVTLSPDITFQIQQFRLYQSTSILLLGRNTSNNPSYLLGFAYTF